MRRWSRRQDTDGPSIAEEAERFLIGRRLDDVFRAGEAVPAWVWLSALAHGDDDVLRDATSWFDVHRGKRPELDSWGRVLQTLAHRLHASSEITGYALHDLQRDVLVPLEYAVMETPVGPATLHRIVSTTLSGLEARVRIR